MRPRGDLPLLRHPDHGPLLHADEGRRGRQAQGLPPSPALPPISFSKTNHTVRHRSVRYKDMSTQSEAGRFDAIRSKDAKLLLAHPALTQGRGQRRAALRPHAHLPDRVHVPSSQKAWRGQLSAQAAFTPVQAVRPSSNRYNDLGRQSEAERFEPLISNTRYEAARRAPTSTAITPWTPCPCRCSSRDGEKGNLKGLPSNPCPAADQPLQDQPHSATEMQLIQRYELTQRGGDIRSDPFEGCEATARSSSPHLSPRGI